MASTGEAWRLGRRPAAFTVVASMALTFLSTVVVVTTDAFGPLGDDWRRAQTAGAMLFRDGDLAVFAHYPEAQMGPLSLLFAVVFPRPAYVLVGCALLGGVMLLAARMPRLSRQTLVIGGCLLAWPWSFYGSTGHLDDALVGVGAAAMIAGHSRRTEWLMGGGFLVAVAGKPTALLLLPLLLVATSRRTWAVAAAGLALVWGPLFLADPAGFLHAGGGYADVGLNSVADWIGAQPGGDFPSWVRPIQFLGGGALCWLLARRGSAAGAVAAAFAFRAILEPGGWAAYSTTVILAGLFFDLNRCRRVVPWVAALAATSYWAAYGREPLTVAEAAARVGLLVAVIAMSWRWSVAVRPARTAAQSPRPRTCRRSVRPTRTTP